MDPGGDVCWRMLTYAYSTPRRCLWHRHMDPRGALCICIYVYVYA
jgi:hypothetical protein